MPEGAMARMRRMLTLRTQPGDPELLSTAAEEVGVSRSSFVRTAAIERAQRVLQADEDEGEEDAETQT